MVLGKKGCPIRIEIGPKEAAQSILTYTKRVDKYGDRKKISLEQIDTLVHELEDIQNAMFNKASKYLHDKTLTITDKNAFLEAAKNHSGFIKIPYCDDTSIEDQLQKISQ